MLLLVLFSTRPSPPRYTLSPRRCAVAAQHTTDPRAYLPLAMSGSLTVIWPFSITGTTLGHYERKPVQCIAPHLALEPTPALLRNTLRNSVCPHVCRIDFICTGTSSLWRKGSRHRCNPERR